MSDLSIRGPTQTALRGLDPNGESVGARGKTPTDNTPPLLKVELGPDLPTLDLPTIAQDALGDMVSKFLSLRLETGDQLIQSQMLDVKDKGATLKSRNDEIAKKLDEAAVKAADAKKTEAAMKVMTWVAVALSVLLAVATGGVGAIVGAAIATTMAVLNETGVMNKLTDAIAKGLEGTGSPPMSAEQAKKTAGLIVTITSIAVSLLTVGAGIAGASATVTAKLATAFPKAAALLSKLPQIPGVVSKLPQLAGGIAARTGVTLTANALEKIMDTAQKVVTGGRILQAANTISQGISGGIGGAQRYEASMLQADVAENRAFIRRLQQHIEDEQDLVQQIVDMMSGVVTKVVSVMEGQADTASDVLRQMRPQTG